MSAKLTALMTTYNCGRYINAAIDSVLAQTFTDFELLIIDDGSLDNTVSLINAYEDPRITLINYSENQGVGARLGQALHHINTPYLVKTDADDISNPHRFAEQLAYLQSSGADIVKCYINYFSDSPDVARSPRFTYFKTIKENQVNAVNTSQGIHQQLPRWLCFPHCSYMAKTALVKQVGYPASRMFEDYGLFLRLYNAGAVFDCINASLVNMRVSNSSTTATASTDELDEGLEVIVAAKQTGINTLGMQGPLYIFGTGGLAQALQRVLAARSIAIEGFIEREQGITSAKVSPVFCLQEILNKEASAKILIAAQPVRDEICTLLAANNLTEWQDYMVIN
ncbi:glycosyltransferase family 2 protein [Salinimonas sediminis]|uniref:Glycosyltransferase family 2 protein n=1 Tax=Salinimonas sediminis TaxID=2303538 RepID=A0A346NJL4_9ALTE|nr:glycosyltransferase family A protein [Salinimonas sediminis]AXR05721.1 glycosyltransferase family 2 protein [Salinimonas sediminis]